MDRSRQRQPPAPCDDSRHAVSILVVVDWSRQPRRQRCRYGRAVMFQSLLSWIGRVNTVTFRSRATDSSAFQSLLSWIGRVNIPGRRSCNRSRRSSFNPCCRGSVASTCRTIAAALAPRVSILVVVDLVASTSPTACRAESRFQSLLSWIGRVNSSDSVSGPPINACFNPCCRGLVASTSASALAESVILVSILVVVDWSRQRWPRLAVASVVRVSILVVVDRSRQPEFSFRTRTGTHGVSILVVVDRSRQRVGAVRRCCVIGEVSILVVVDWSRQRTYGLRSVAV